jgi:hypothetical protein
MRYIPNSDMIDAIPKICRILSNGFIDECDIQIHSLNRYELLIRRGIPGAKNINTSTVSPVITIQGARSGTHSRYRGV